MTESEFRKLIQKETDRNKDKECQIIAMAIGCKNLVDEFDDYLNYPIIFRKCVNCENDIYIDVLEYHKHEARMYDLKSLRVMRNEKIKDAISLLYQSCLGGDENTMYLEAGLDFTDDSLFEAWNALIKFRKSTMSAIANEEKKRKDRLDSLNEFMISIAANMRIFEVYSNLSEYRDQIPVSLRAMMRNMVDKYRKAGGRLD